MLLKHKHLRLDQEKLERVKALLGVSTDTEAIDRAMDLVLEEDLLNNALRRTRAKAKGRIRAVFEPDE